MSDATATDVASLLLRVVLGVTLIAHGWNHWLGGGKIAGTARWFASLGLRPGILHARSSVVVELGAGLLLLVGLATPLACTAVVGVMTVAGIAAHRPNGFFVFKDGYEYVLNLAVAASALAVLGPGRLSLDHDLDVVVDGTVGGLVAAAGVLAALGMLAACWRPQRKGAADPAVEGAGP